MLTRRGLGAGTALVAVAVGSAWTVSPPTAPAHLLPSGLPHSCCSDGIAAASPASRPSSAPAWQPPSIALAPSPGEHEVLAPLRDVVGADAVLTSSTDTATFVKGARLGGGPALAVVVPSRLEDVAAVLQHCVDHNVAVVPQGANTGLTGASVPRPAGVLDRPTVVLSMRRLNTVTPVAGGAAMVCLAGAGIRDVATAAAAYDRESHSVLGSMFLNPSVAAGVAFGSGGTQLRKGPVYTERALYCRVTKDGTVEVVNTLGVEPPPGVSLHDALQAGTVRQTAAPAAKCWDSSYAARVCQLDAAVSRFNADTTGPDVNRSEGKVVILASVHATFPAPRHPDTLWIACRDFATAQALKATVCVNNPRDLPKSVEYMDRDSFDVVDGSGRALCWALSVLGVGETLCRLWGWKLRLDTLPFLPSALSDRLLHWAQYVLPAALPRAIHGLGTTMDHHLLVTVGDYDGGDGDEGDADTTRARFHRRLQQFIASQPDGAVQVHTCTAKEAAKVSYFRFAAAPAFRTWCVGTGNVGVSVDYALPKNCRTVPPTGAEQPARRMRYSHFGCNVVHEDLAYAPHVDADAEKKQLKAAVEALGGRLPAEHGFGTEYVAPPDTQQRWMAMDPTNALNPGVGGTSTRRHYGRDGPR